MRSVTSLKNTVAALACVGMLMGPSLAMGQQPAAGQRLDQTPPSIVDVGLGEGGTLMGQIVGANGAPSRNVRVVVSQGGQQVAATLTDGEGGFHVTGLRGGIYQVTAAGTVKDYRLWSAHTAPPAARPAVMLVAGAPTVRGQWMGSSCAVPILVTAVTFGTILGVTLGTQQHDGDPAS